MDCLRKSYKWYNEKVPTRYVIYLMVFLGTTTAYALRANLNVAIVAMVRPRPKSNGSSSVQCPASGTSKNKTKMDGEFDWDEAAQENILGCFYWGYIVTSLLGGILSQKFSAKWVAGLGIFSTAFFTLLTPVAARTGLWYLIAVRILEGIGEGVTFPAFYALVATWSPPHERSVAVSLIHIGDAVGTVISSPISAALVESPLDGGWPFVFYCFGTLGVLWFICWCFLVYDSPNVHPRIPKKEKMFLTSLHQPVSSTTTLNEEDNDVNDKANFPWIPVLKSPAFWGLLVGHVGYKWGYFTLFTQLPTYMKSVLHFNTYQSALLSAVPYVCRMILSMLCSYLVDTAIEKNIWTVGRWRKIAHTLGDGLGTILASPVSAVLMTKSLDGGWPLVFYCFGSMGVLWVILWAILIYESPTVHPRIDEEEKNYILTSLASVTSLESSNGNVESEEAKWRIFPWKEALTSPAVWALIAGHIAHTWGFMTLLTELPNYMKTVLHFDTKQSAMLSAVPYIAKMVLSLIVGYLVDLALKNNILSVLNWRRIINTLGNVVPALLFIAVPFIGCNKYGALAALTASAGFQGITSASHLVNNIDIAPNHAGIVHGIMSTPGSLPKILAPYLTGYLTNDSSTIESWSTVFYIAAGFHIVGNFIYVIFARGEPQSWD